MKKRNNSPEQAIILHHNPVARFAHCFNKSCRFDDKTKYRRSIKHKKQEVSLIVLLINSVISEAA